MPVSQKGGQWKLLHLIVSLFYHQSINHYWFYAWTFEKQYFLLLYMYMCRAWYWLTDLLVQYINNAHCIFRCWTLSIKVFALWMNCMNFDLQVLSQLISLHWTGYVYMYMYSSPSKSWYSTCYCFYFVRVTAGAILLQCYIYISLEMLD